MEGMVWRGEGRKGGKVGMLVGGRETRGGEGGRESMV
jgi:hypothetical protein